MYQWCEPETSSQRSYAGATIMHYSPRGRKPGIGAGTATLLVFRFLLTCVRGSVLTALREPMGDNLIAPLFEYLRDSGV